MAEQETDALAMLAHELRTPLSTIVAAAAGLERGGDQLPRDKQRALVRLLATEAERLARLVDDIVAAAKIDAGQLPIQLTDTVVADVVADAAYAAQTTAPRSRSIDHQASGDTTAQSDPDRLRQVIDNLIDNAVKHADGSVDVTTRRLEDVVRVEIVDDGPGIPPHQENAIFEKFRRLDSPASGSGLGLWLCHELVNRMNGRIWVTDAPAGGACFVIELPAA